jgi:hypothetical protein
MIHRYIFLCGFSFFAIAQMVGQPRMIYTDYASNKGHIDPYSKQLYAYLGKSGKYGLVDSLGMVVMQPQWDSFPSQAFFHYGSYISLELGQVGYYNYLPNGQVLTEPIIYKSGDESFFAFRKPTIEFGQYDDHNSKPMRKIMQILGVADKDSFSLINLRTGKRVTRKEQPDSSLFYNDKHQPNMMTARFQFGLLRIAEGDLTNFLDTNLNRVFVQPVYKAMAVDEKYILVANQENKLAIADHTGKIRSPFGWKALSPIPKTDLFLADIVPTRFDGKSFSSSMHVINARGKVIVKPENDEIRTGVGLFYAKKLGKLAIFDAVGKQIIEVTEAATFEAIGQEGLFCLKSAGVHSLYDAQNKKPFIGAYDDVQLAAPQNQNLLVICRSGNVLHVFNEKGQLLTTENASYVKLLAPQKKSKYHFIVEGVNYASSCYVMEGERLFLDSIRCALLLQDDKTKLFYLIDLTGKRLLPAQYAQIDLKDDMLLARPEGKFLSETYDWKGNRLSQPKWADPLGNVVNIDGELILARAKGVREFDLFNQMGESIVPSGYVVHEALFTLRNSEQTGYFPVIRITKAEARTQVKTKEPHLGGEMKMKAPEEISDNSLERYGKGKSEQELPFVGKNMMAGVIDSKGSWVIEPKPNVIFKPIGTHMITEHLLDAHNQPYGQAAKLHIVGSAHARVVDVENVFTDTVPVVHSVKVVVKVMANEKNFGQNDAHDANGNLFRIGWLDPDGKHLTKFEYVEGPNVLQKHNLVIYQDGIDEFLTIMDDQGKELKRFEKNILARSPWKQMRFYTLERSNKTMPFQEFALMDSTGTFVVPFRSQSLSYDETVNLLHVSGYYHSVNTLDGEIIQDSLLSRVVFTRLSHGLTAFDYLTAKSIDKQGTLVFNEQGNLIHKFPQRFLAIYRDCESRAWLMFIDDAGKKYLADPLSRRQFRE